MGRWSWLVVVLLSCGDKAGSDDDDDDDGVGATDADGDGYDSVASGGSDCDDTDPLINISAIEVCNGVDDDCDGAIDEDASDAELVYRDGDGDGYGLSTDSVRACDLPSGYAAELGDCDDEAPEVNPGAPEACDGVDTDCSGSPAADEVDADGDGFPGCEVAAHGWLGSEGYTEGDCDDSDGSVHPGAEEVCDGVDTDCDGALLDEEADLDGDGFDTCRYGDCDDDDGTVNPGALEDCSDGEDQDCDELVDCQDDDCDGDPACVEICDNGTDDDGDSLVDCEDGDCADSADCVEDCEDGVDNDLDGLTDCADFDDCAGTATCPVIRQVHLSSGSEFAYGLQYRGMSYFVVEAYSLSGTVGTFDSAASSWKTCNWAVGTASYFASGAGVATGTVSFSPTRSRTSVTGSCGMSRVNSFLPGALTLNQSSAPRVGRLTHTTALGSTAAPWYGPASGSYTYAGGGFSYWVAYGGMSSQTFWE